MILFGSPLNNTVKINDAKPVDVMTWRKSIFRNFRLSHAAGTSTGECSKNAFYDRECMVTINII